MLNKGITKPFKTYQEQLQILISRGLIVSDQNQAAAILKQINYYRFSAYSLTLRKDNTFYEGVTFENVLELYNFDAALRRIVLAYCQIVETSFRSILAYYFSEKYGPLGYMDPVNFNNSNYHSSFISELEKEVDRSSDIFIEHHKREKNSVFPFWVVIEASSFGLLSKFVKNMVVSDRNELAKKYVGYSRQYMENWLQTSVNFRNIAAHGGRFYNRELKATPVFINAKRYPNISNTSVYANFIALYNLVLSSTNYYSVFVPLFENNQLFNNIMI